MSQWSDGSERSPEHLDSWLTSPLRQVVELIQSDQLARLRLVNQWLKGEVGKGKREGKRGAGGPGELEELEPTAGKAISAGSGS